MLFLSQCQFKDNSGLFLIIVDLIFIIVAILTVSHANFAHHLPYRDLGNLGNSTYIGARSSSFLYELNNMNHLKCLSLSLT